MTGGRSHFLSPEGLDQSSYDSNIAQDADNVKYKIDPERALNTLKDFDDVLNGNKPKVEIAHITPELANRIYRETGIKISPNSGVDFDRNSAIHTITTHGQGGKKPALPLNGTDIAALPYTIEQADTIKRGYNKRGAQRIVFEKEIGRNRKAVTEVIKKGDTLRVVTYFNDTSSGRTDAAHNVSSSNDTSETGQLQSTYLDKNISQDADNVKMKLTDTEHMETTGSKNPDLDADKYINEQVKAQKKAEKVGLIQKLEDKKALAKHHLVDDAVSYERYMTKEQKKSSLRDEIRNDIDKVRSSDMIAQQFIRDNGLSELGKLSTKELNQFQQYLIARRHAADLHKKGMFLLYAIIRE